MAGSRYWPLVRPTAKDDAPDVRVPEDASLFLWGRVSARPRPGRLRGKHARCRFEVPIKCEPARHPSWKHHAQLRLKEIGALFGAILADQGAEICGFGDDFQTVPMHVDTPVLQRQDAVLAIDEDVGNSTNGWKALEYLRDRGEPVERVVVFTDMQIWDSTPFTARDTQTVKTAFDAYRDEVSTDTSLYLVDLASYGDLVTPEGYENVYNISGWSENVLSFIEHAENPKQVIDEINAFEPA